MTLKEKRRLDHFKFNLEKEKGKYDAAVVVYIEGKKAIPKSINDKSREHILAIIHDEMTRLLKRINYYRDKLNKSPLKIIPR